MKTVVITGSTRGLGKALACALRALGHNVVVTGRTAASVDAAVAAVLATADVSPAGGSGVAGVACDVAKLEDVRAVWQAAVSRFQRVDVWINNAGLGGRPLALAEQDEEDIGPVVATNLVGTMNGARVAIEGMRAQGGGAVYNVEGFGSGGQVREGMAVYGATKVAVRYFTKSLLAELKGGPVVVATIVPGMVVTDMLREQYDAATAKRRGLYEKLADKPETIAAALVPQILANTESGAVISWLTLPKVLGRLASPSSGKRNVFG